MIFFGLKRRFSKEPTPKVCFLRRSTINRRLKVVFCVGLLNTDAVDYIFCDGSRNTDAVSHYFSVAPKLPDVIACFYIIFINLNNSYVYLLHQVYLSLSVKNSTKTPVCLPPISRFSSLGLLLISRFPISHQASHLNLHLNLCVCSIESLCLLLI